MQPMPITIKVASTNPDHGEVYSIQPCVIKFLCDLWFIVSCFHDTMRLSGGGGGGGGKLFKMQC